MPYQVILVIVVIRRMRGCTQPGQSRRAIQAVTTPELMSVG
jgi:hypothetical protein